MTPGLNIRFHGNRSSGFLFSFEKFIAGFELRPLVHSGANCQLISRDFLGKFIILLKFMFKIRVHYCLKEIEFVHKTWYTQKIVVGKILNLVLNMNADILNYELVF